MKARFDGWSPGYFSGRKGGRDLSGRRRRHLHKAGPLVFMPRPFGEEGAHGAKGFDIYNK